MIHFIESLVGGTLVATLLAIWMWPKSAMDPQFSRRLVTEVGTWLFSLMGFAVAFGARPSLMWAGLAGGAFALAAVSWHRLRAAPLSDGEATTRVIFEGTVHELSGLTKLPGEDKWGGYKCVAWVIRQGSKRWSSESHFEVRSGAHRVFVDPAAMTVLGKPWDAEYFTLRNLADDLRVSRDKLLRVWMINEGDQVFVIGETTLDEDAARAGYRDPERVHRFSRNVRVARGSRATALRRVWMYLAAAIAFGVAAGALAIIR